MPVTEPAPTVAPVISISPMNEHDLLEVVEIEQSSHLSPWGWDAYHRELQGNDRRLMWVARLDSKPARDRALAGYIAARLAADELHINNVAVRDAYRRNGIATALILRLLSEARACQAKKAFLEVRAGNVPAQALYEGCGFYAVGRRRNYYSNPPEDALIMAAELGESA